MVENYRLTRSIHRMYAVKSGEGIDFFKGDFLNAHRDTEEKPRYSEVPLRIRCSYVVLFLQIVRAASENDLQILL